MWRHAALALAVVAAAALVPAIRHLREAPRSPEPPIVLTLAPQASTEFSVGADLAFDLAIAPHGREMIFAASSNGEVQLWRRALDSDRAMPIPGTAGAVLPAYAADGTRVWYFAERALRMVNLRDGARRDIAAAHLPGGVSVRSDEAVLFVPGPGPIKRLAGSTSVDATVLHEGERTHAFPSWIGAGEAFVYLATRDDGRRTIRLRDQDHDVELARTDSHGEVVGGNLIYVRDGVLRAERLDPDARRLGPGTHTLAIDVGVSPAGRGAFAVSERLLLSASSASRAGVLRWFALGDRALAPIAEPGDFWQVRLSPDDRMAALTVRDPLLRTLDIFTMPAAGGYPARFTFALAVDTDPVWAADGRRVAFRSSQDGQPNIYSRLVNASGGQDEPIWRSPLDEIPTDWTPANLVFSARSSDTGFDIWRLPRGADKVLAVARSTFNEVDGRVSPDGTWIAYASDEAGQFDVYVARLADGAGRIRVSTAGGTKPQWTAGGRALMFRRGDDVMRAEVSLSGPVIGTSVPARMLVLPGLRDFAVTRDGTRLLAIVPGDLNANSSIRVVVEWQSLLDNR